MVQGPWNLGQVVRILLVKWYASFPIAVRARLVAALSASPADWTWSPRDQFFARRASHPFAAGATHEGDPKKVANPPLPETILGGRHDILTLANRDKPDRSYSPIYGKFVNFVKPIHLESDNMPDINLECQRSVSIPPHVALSFAEPHNDPSS